jgi:hypothetical protein
MFVFLDENEPACGQRSPESRRRGRRSHWRGREVTTPSWSLRALNDEVGGSGEVFTIKKREVTRMSLLAHDAPAIAEPGKNERIFLSPGPGPGVL